MTAAAQKGAPLKRGNSHRLRPCAYAAPRQACRRRQRANPAVQRNRSRDRCQGGNSDARNLSITVSCTAVDDSEEIRGAEVSKGWQAVGPPRQSGGTIGRVIDYFSTKSVTVVAHAPAISARHYGCARFAAAH